MRDGDWKFIRRFDPSESDELFNLANDPYETINLLNVQKDRADAMRKQTEQWLKDINAVEPQLKRKN